MLDAEIGPGLEVVDRIDHPPTDPAIGGAGPEIAMLLEGPARKAEKARGFQSEADRERAMLEAGYGKLGNLT